MTKRHGYALLAAICALIVAISAAIYAAGVTVDGRGGAQPLAGGRPHNPAAPASTGTWVGAWSASPVGGEPGTERNGLAGRSVRNVVHAGIGGTSARVTLSNLYGQQPLTVSHASIAVAATANSPVATADSMRRLTFGGSTSVVVPAGRQIVSDVVRITFPRDADLLVTTYSSTPSGPVTYHPQARQISYTAEGNRTEDVTGKPYTTQTLYWRYVTAVDVLSNEADGTVVVLGDSITDGSTSTVGTNRRWTDALAARLREAAGSSDVPRYSVVNQGISGNRVLTSGSGRPAENPSGLSRFQRDVLGRTGVRAVVIDLGVNDILRNPGQADPEAILDGLRQMVDRAHARGLRVIGATLMPFQGHRGYRDDREAVRQAVNAEIRAGRVYDAVVDFDEALRDPYNPRRLRAHYDSGDHLHPSDAGYARMAEVFDLEELKGSASAEL
ncbi:SGNH/GDSL hydrolase family protein [Streptomyces poonensis]|uniref:SGNH hydrolase n=1 Tax=Streptomyces poonensis TaxID=68255 RepID=A0A918PVP7_9ACTN|nr:SGNH/GDSL hydrolase family protein [Streptomyces poonensis]GGZ22463.1 SGNH hydrolase [Streptomyces poonensis]GLJ91822.1 SGNH hydrolase [Streptomyces poonensis]